MTRLSKSKNWQKKKYNLIFVVIDWFTKIIYYKPILIIINMKLLAQILIKMVTKYHSLLDSIVTNWGLLFMSKI